MEKEHVLKVIKTEQIPDYTMILQLGDGTRIYFKHSSPSKRLYVKWKGTEIDAKLPDNVQHCSDFVGIHENSIYLRTYSQIYRCSFTPRNSFVVSAFRDILKGEGLWRSGVCSVAQNSRIYFFRVWEVNDRFDIDNETTEKWGVPKALLIHRQKLIIFTTKSDNVMEPRAHLLNDKVIIVKAPSYPKDVHTPSDSCPFIYVLYGEQLYVLNAESLLFFLPLRIKGISYTCYIANVHNGTISIQGVDETRKNLLISAQLPEEYCNSAIGSSQNTVREELLPESKLFHHRETTLVGGTRVRPGTSHTRARSQNSMNGIQDAFRSKFTSEFEIRKILGAGSFGVVFKAANILDHWDYAVKRIAVALEDNIIEKALREVRAMAQFDHPGIVRYNSTWIETPPEGWQTAFDTECCKLFPAASMPMAHSYSNNPVLIYIQMQLCEYSLEVWLKRQNTAPRDLPRMHSWFRQLVSAVAYIHEQGFIHRDLKPSNVMFAGEDRLKVCDLGIATQLRIVDGEDVTSTLTSIGTPLYMAPEQGGWYYNNKVDVFTLGLIFTELCVIMADNERKQIFSDFRCGKPSVKLQEQPRTANFIAWITQLDSENRPTSREMLNHVFLA